ncbi:DUF6292 family protein [Streptomonospora sp. S1-112]|uniref:DUF6292 family protein n=1 Tax=Streptomonospora mangrovi TaxID=2883123 RepID=A0A9X3SEK4_9ACTN|nr:DUF6292 family protein [Streptomonospora mangrovi]MDA0565978.1 DUF6292 family protein [Streptomonospora mangrovi]
MPYSAPWVDLPRPYVELVAQCLIVRGVDVLDHWNDPLDPRDVSVIVRAGGPGGPGRLRFVWDEESGWRFGPMDAEGWVALERTRYLPGGLLPRPGQVAAVVGRVLAGTETGSPHRPRYRSFRDYGDGFDARLAAYARAALPR